MWPRELHAPGTIKRPGFDGMVASKNASPLHFRDEPQPRFRMARTPVARGGALASVDWDWTAKL